MNRHELSATGYGHQVKRRAEQSGIIQLTKIPTTIQKPEHKEVKNNKNIPSSHLHYMSKSTSLKLVIY